MKKSRSSAQQVVRKTVWGLNLQPKEEGTVGDPCTSFCAASLFVLKVPIALHGKDVGILLVLCKFFQDQKQSSDNLCQSSFKNENDRIITAFVLSNKKKGKRFCTVSRAASYVGCGMDFEGPNQQKLQGIYKKAQQLHIGKMRGLQNLIIYITFSVLFIGIFKMHSPFNFDHLS